MFEKISALKNDFKSAYTELGVKVLTKVHHLDDNGVIDISVGAVIGMAVGLIVIAAIIPSAIEMFYSVDTSAWAIGGNETGYGAVADDKAVTLWWLLPFIAVATVLYMLYKRME